MVVDGYVRVSVVGDRAMKGERFISPQVQRDQILGWVQARRAAIGVIFEELDESGARADRPLLMNAIARVESGESDGLVVARLDRFGRSLTDSLSAIERIQAAGGIFASVDDGLDLTTDTGRLVLRVLLSLAEWELDRIRANWREARRRAVERGVFVGRVPPTGYCRAPSGRLVPDSHDGPVITELFARRAARQPLTSLCRFLEEAGVKTAYGNSVWRPENLRDLFFNRSYLGDAHSGEFVKPGAHTPLVDPVTFQLVQRPATLRPQWGRLPGALVGLVRCGGCRFCLQHRVRRQAGAAPYRVYLCPGAHAAGRCPTPASAAAVTLEPFVERALFERAARQPRVAEKHAADLERRIAAEERALAAYRDSSRVLGTLGEERYAAGLEARARRLDRLRSEFATLHTRRSRPPLPGLRQLERLWPTLTVHQRREFLAEHIDCIVLWRGRLQIETRIQICWRGEGPSELPRQGGQHEMFAPLLRPARPPHPFGRPASRWSARRIRVELRAFLDGLDEWPAFDAFVLAGQRALHDQVMAHGGAQHWAAVAGVRYRPNRHTMVSWSEERVREELRPLLKGRTSFPTKRELQRGLGRWALGDHVSASGGVERWAREFGLPRSGWGRGRPTKWTEQAIRATLAELVEGRSQWPGTRVFTDEGLCSVRNAIYKGRGMAAWAAEFGFDYPPPRRSRAKGRERSTVSAPGGSSSIRPRTRARPGRAGEAATASVRPAPGRP
jgi:site-specific DNA recombinase